MGGGGSDMTMEINLLKGFYRGKRLPGVTSFKASVAYRVEKVPDDIDEVIDREQRAILESLRKREA